MLASFAYSLFLGLFITLFVLVSLLLVLIVLIQKGRGGGLASAFGGGGGNTAFGSKTGDVLTWATSIIFGIFLLLAVILNLMTRQTNKPAVAATPALPSQQAPLKSGAPTATPPSPTQTPQPGSATPPAPTGGLTAPRPTTQPAVGK